MERKAFGGGGELRVCRSDDEFVLWSFGGLQKGQWREVPLEHP